MGLFNSLFSTGRASKEAFQRVLRIVKCKFYALPYALQESTNNLSLKTATDIIFLVMLTWQLTD